MKFLNLNSAPDLFFPLSPKTGLITIPSRHTGLAPVIDQETSNEAAMDSKQ